MNEFISHEEFIECLEDVFRLASNEGMSDEVNQIILYLKEKYSIEINKDVANFEGEFNFLKSLKKHEKR